MTYGKLAYSLLVATAVISGVPAAIPAADPCNGIPAEMTAQRLEKRDAARTVSAMGVLQRHKEGRETMLVDVRRREMFERFRIPGSINVPLHFVKTKLFLKKKPFVLLDEGLEYSLLTEECRKLAKGGFPCSVLYGGLTAWRNEEGPLEGDHVAWRSLGSMPPATWFLEKNGEDWLMIDVSRQRSTLSGCLLPDAVHVDISGSSQWAVSGIRDAGRKRRTGSFDRILIFNEKGADYDSLCLLAGKAGLKNVFYLEGGLEQYATYLNQLRLSAVLREARLKTTTGCGSTCGGMNDKMR